MPPSSRIEPRWPIALTTLVVLGLLTILPDRVRLVSIWLPYVLGVILLGVMTLVPLTSASRWARQMERIVLFLFCLIVGIGTLAGLAYLLYEMVNQSNALSGLELLTSSIAVWINSVLMFSLLYWQVDLGGPEARLRRPHTQPDWLFAQATLPDEQGTNWRPTFVDYLFLAYTTATAFSATDTLPLTARAKLLMMAESTISLATILVVVSRAINILGS